MVLASLLSITLVPVLMTMFIRGRRLRPESANPVSRFFTWFYAPVLRAALRFKWTALLLNFAIVPLTIPLLFAIGSEFMPPLYEGSMLYMPTSPPGMSITEATRVLQVQDKLLGADMATRTVVWTLAILAIVLVVIPLLGMFGMMVCCGGGMMGMGGNMMGGTMMGMSIVGLIWMLLAAAVVIALVVIAARSATGS